MFPNCGDIRSYFRILISGSLVRVQAGKFFNKNLSTIINGGELDLISDYLVVPYAVDGRPTIKKLKTINANRIKNAVRSLVANMKAAMQAPAMAYAVAA